MNKPIRQEAWIDELVAEAAAIDAEEAKKAGAVGYMARLLAQATMPYSPTKELVHQRCNGLISVRLVADPEVGLPYGHFPRVIMCWITTEAVRTRKNVLALGRNLSSFMEQLNLVPTGGRWGSIARLRNHLDRLFGATITSIEEQPGHISRMAVKPIEGMELWWDPKRPEEDNLWNSRIALNKTFFESIIERPIPLDLRIMRALAKLRSPMAIDIYCWLTYRVSYIDKPTKTIPWPLIQLQMGASFDRVRSFREAFLHWLKVVHVLYPSLQVEVVEPSQGRKGGGGGLVLKPCRPSVAPVLPAAVGVGSPGSPHTSVGSSGFPRMSGGGFPPSEG